MAKAKRFRLCGGDDGGCCDTGRSHCTALGMSDLALKGVIGARKA